MISKSVQKANGSLHLAIFATAIMFCAGPLFAEAQLAHDPSSGSEPKLVVANLQASCNSEVLQAIASKLSIGVSVKNVADAPRFQNGVKYFAASGNRPAFCEVSGSFVTDPKVGRTANFLAVFPEAWNSKYLQIGCSGHCGNFYVSDPAVSTITITNQGYPGESIMKGYASFSTDEGHETMAGGDWAVKGPGQIDQGAVDDFFYRADKTLAPLGKAFAAAFYSQMTGSAQKVVRSYFIGCSGGGRDALVAASFFPEEFDGIIAGSAYADMVGVSFQTEGIDLANARSKDAGVPPVLLAKVDSFVKANCDALDGVKDGLIQNPAACNFIPSRDLPVCDGKNPADNCFTKAQIESISAAVSAVTDEHGNVVQPGYSISELNVAMGTSAGGGISLTPLADAVMKIFVHKNDPDYKLDQLVKFGDGGSGPVTNFHTIVPQSEAAFARSVAHMGIGAQPESARTLIKQNRKLLIWANLSDEKLTPYMSINYYKRLSKLYGGYTRLQNNVRLFLLPGTGHCSMNGCGPTSFDAISAMEDWVENGKAPDSLVATQFATRPSANRQMPPVVDRSKPPVRTMPLCKFPEMAHYSGRGDVSDAANWSCPANDKSMLKIGESGRQAGVIE
ncbi:MAG TPA: tannase/feruloyl esterase family alpha/beta hydrolase [Terracidiphilus sp.]|nr:tannase/feruloyl esterase family alpha/beta hydrolase [Terracidiphilus sp.]